MKQQLIKEITDEVVKYVPEIMELKFGCKVEYSDHESEPSEVMIGNPYEHRKGKIVNPYNLDDSGDLFAVLGRDITLEDVLIASQHYFNIEQNACGKTLILSIEDPNGYDGDKIYTDWQLGKPLHEQDEGTLQFIRDILK